MLLTMGDEGGELARGGGRGDGKKKKGEEDGGGGGVSVAGPSGVAVGKQSQGAGKGGVKQVGECCSSLTFSERFF